MIKAIRVALSGAVVCLAAFSAQAAETKKVDVLLVGGGIMSSTLGVWLHELEPDWSMMMVERLDGVAQESSNGWNNAGTGHSALAELNYTPEKSNGKIDISKAVEINEGFQVTRQFWTYQVKTGVLKNPRSFINSTPHMSFVWGEDNVRYLQKRYEALQASPLFRGMQFSDDYDQISKWVPLMMEGRDRSQKVAATWMPVGTDVNFGEITRQFVGYLQSQPQFTLSLSSEVRDIKRNDDGTWRVSYVNLKSGDRQDVDTKFLFIGAGGGALRLLQASGIPEARDFAAFPVGGSFLVTENPEVVNRHLAKAYGKASVGSPPMSVP
ncbi:malate:quinone oxidoreductase, partial [Ralstonia pseudosolanacearum]